MLKRHAKKWFTLIEMLIVIVIIGILAAYLIPRIWSAQGKARDVARKADLRQYSAALSSYMLDHRHYIQATWCVSDVLKDLVDNGYITSIDKDPSSTGGPNCTSGYYYYAWNTQHYMIVSAVDEKTSANWCSDQLPAVWTNLAKDTNYSTEWCGSTTGTVYFIQTD